MWKIKKKFKECFGVVYLKYVVSDVTEFYAVLTSVTEATGEHRVEPLRRVHQHYLVRVEYLAFYQELDVRQLRVVHEPRIYREQGPIC